MDLRTVDNRATSAGQARIARVMSYNRDIRRLKDDAKSKLDDAKISAGSLAQEEKQNEGYAAAINAPHAANAVNNIRKYGNPAKYGKNFLLGKGVEEGAAESERVGAEIGERLTGSAARTTTNVAERTVAEVGELGRAGRSVAASLSTIHNAESVGQGVTGAIRAATHSNTLQRVGGVAEKVAVAGGADAAAVKTVAKGLGKAAGVAGAAVNIVSAGKNIIDDISSGSIGGKKDANSWEKASDITQDLSGLVDVAGLAALAFAAPIAAPLALFGAGLSIVSSIVGAEGAEKRAEETTKEATQDHQKQIENIGQTHSVPTEIASRLTAKAFG